MNKPDSDCDLDIESDSEEVKNPGVMEGLASMKKSGYANQEEVSIQPKPPQFEESSFNPVIEEKKFDGNGQDKYAGRNEEQP